MLLSSRKIFGIPARSIPRLALGAAPAGIVLSLLLFWLNDQLGTPDFWRAGLAFLTVFESAYLVALTSLLVGTPVLALQALRRSGLPARRPAVVRGLLAVASLAMSLLLAEAIASAWLHRARQSTVLPVGGLGQSWQEFRQKMSPPVSPADIPLPESFPDPPGDPEIDLVVVGESSAEGVPYNEWLSIGQLVAWKLREAIPGRRVRVQVLAFSGETLELQHQRLASLTRRPDLMIVYCGHNEFSSRLHGARDLEHYLDARVRGAWRRLLDRAEAVSALCELIRQASDRCRLAIPPPPFGDRDLIDTPAYTTAESSLLISDFRRRLEAIVSYARRVGAIVVLIAPPGNDAGFEPNRSFLPAATPRRERADVRRDFVTARALEARDPPAAIAAYRDLIARQPGFAESHYRLGLLLDQAGDSEGAYRHFVAARDRDGYPTRCPTAFQDVYRELASRHGAILVDGQAEMHAVGRRGQLDDHLFQDAMHPSLRGQIALAQAVLRMLRARRVFGWPEGTPAPLFDPAQCVSHFRLGREAWKKIILWGVHFGNSAQGLRYDPAPRLRRRRLYAEAFDRLVAGESVEDLGLPNVGTPEPVPPVDDRDPSRISRSDTP
jgi:lysophospholipase L1-like esterase